MDSCDNTKSISGIDSSEDTRRSFGVSTPEKRCTYSQLEEERRELNALFGLCDDDLVTLPSERLTNFQLRSRYQVKSIEKYSSKKSKKHLSSSKRDSRAQLLRTPTPSKRKRNLIPFERTNFLENDASSQDLEAMESFLEKFPKRRCRSVETEAASATENVNIVQEPSKLDSEFSKLSIQEEQNGNVVTDNNRTNTKRNKTCKRKLYFVNKDEECIEIIPNDEIRIPLRSESKLAGQEDLFAELWDIEDLGVQNLACGENKETQFKIKENRRKRSTESDKKGNEDNNDYLCEDNLLEEDPNEEIPKGEAKQKISLHLTAMLSNYCSEFDKPQEREELRPTSCSYDRNIKLPFESSTCKMDLNVLFKTKSRDIKNTINNIIDHLYDSDESL